MINSMRIKEFVFVSVDDVYSVIIKCYVGKGEGGEGDYLVVILRGIIGDALYYLEFSTAVYYHKLLL